MPSCCANHSVFRATPHRHSGKMDNLLLSQASALRMLAATMIDGKAKAACHRCWCQHSMAQLLCRSRPVLAPCAHTFALGLCAGVLHSVTRTDQGLHGVSEWGALPSQLAEEWSRSESTGEGHWKEWWRPSSGPRQPPNRRAARRIENASWRATRRPHQLRSCVLRSGAPFLLLRSEHAQVVVRGANQQAACIAAKPQRVHALQARGEGGAGFHWEAGKDDRLNNGVLVGLYASLQAWWQGPLAPMHEQHRLCQHRVERKRQATSFPTFLGRSVNSLTTAQSCFTP